MMVVHLYGAATTSGSCLLLSSSIKIKTSGESQDSPRWNPSLVKAMEIHQMVFKNLHRIDGGERVGGVMPKGVCNNVFEAQDLIETEVKMAG